MFDLYSIQYYHEDISGPLGVGLLNTQGERSHGSHGSVGCQNSSRRSRQMLQCLLLQSPEQQYENKYRNKTENMT